MIILKLVEPSALSAVLVYTLTVMVLSLADLVQGVSSLLVSKLRHVWIVVLVASKEILASHHVRHAMLVLSHK